MTMLQFRTRWIESEVMKVNCRNVLLQELHKFGETCEIAIMPTQEENGFFSISSPSSQTVAAAEVEGYMTNTVCDLDVLNAYLLVRKVFLQYNTVLPSSAPVERLFSMGGYILTPHHTRLSDTNFEMLVLLRAIKDIR